MRIFSMSDNCMSMAFFADPGVHFRIFEDFLAIHNYAALNINNNASELRSDVLFLEN